MAEEATAYAQVLTMLARDIIAAAVYNLSLQMLRTDRFGVV